MSGARPRGRRQVYVAIGLAAAAMIAFAALRGRAPTEAGPPAGYYPRPAPAPDFAPALAAGDLQTGQALYTQGRSGVQACIGCHGRNGLAAPGSQFPRLGGVSADYVAKELYDYRAGRRKNEIMTGIAGALTPAEAGSVALYLASLAPVWPEPSGAEAPARGRELQEAGDNALAIPACGNCHGPQGRGSDQSLPPLAGLAPEYVMSQLRAWQSGARHNDPNGVMTSIAHRLSEYDVRAAAGYYGAFR